MKKKQVISILIALSLSLALIPIGKAASDEWIIRTLDEDLFFGPNRFDDVDMVYLQGDNIQIHGWYRFEGPVIQWGRHIKEAYLSVRTPSIGATDLTASMTIYGLPSRKGGAPSYYDNPGLINGPYTTSYYNVNLSGFVGPGVWHNITVTNILREISQGYYHYDGHDVAFVMLSADNHDEERTISSEESGHAAKLYIHYKPPEFGDPEFPPDLPEDAEWVEDYRNYTVWRVNGSGVDGWDWKKTHTIEGSAAGALTDYQIKIELTYDESNPTVGGFEGSNPIIAGNWREISNILHDPDDSGKEYKLYLTHNVNGDIYYVNSTDRINWNSPTKVIDEAYHVQDPYIVKEGATYFLFCENLVDGGTHHKIDRYTSADGETFAGKSTVFEKTGGGWESQQVSSPTIWIEGSTWYMLYEGMASDTEGQTGIASSSDQGLNWVRSGSNPVLPYGANGEWDDETTCPDGITKKDGIFTLTYTGKDAIGPATWKSGIATSTNLITWIRNDGNPVNFPEYSTPGEEMNDLMGFYDSVSGLYVYIYEQTGDTIYMGYLNIQGYGDEINLEGNCRSDFGDVRFIQSSSFIDYYLEEKSDGDYAIFWVEVPNIPGDPNSTTIDIIYGNPTATNVSDGKATFIEFDDFDDNNINATIWETGTSGGAGTVNEVNQRIEVTQESDGVNGEYRYIKLLKNYNLTETPICIMAYVDWGGENVTQNDAGICLSEVNTTVANPYLSPEAFRLMFFNGATTVKDYYLQRRNGGSTTIKSGDADIYEGIFDLYITPTKVRADIDREEWQAYIAHTYTLTPMYVYLYRGGKTASTLRTDFDLFWIRQAIELVPIQGTWGEEENQTVLPYYYVTDDNGTLVWNGTLNGDDIEDIIDEDIIGYPNPEDPNPPGWEDTGYLTAHRFKFILFMIGMILSMGTLMFGFYAKPDAATWIIIFFCMFCGVSLLWALQTM